MPDIPPMPDIPSMAMADPETAMVLTNRAVLTALVRDIPMC
jgi:hypothetical protein